MLQQKNLRAEADVRTNSGAPFLRLHFNFHNSKFLHLYVQLSFNYDFISNATFVI